MAPPAEGVPTGTTERHPMTMRSLVLAISLLTCGAASAVESTMPYAVVKRLPRGVEVEGAIVEARSFSDATGEHLVVVSHTDEPTGQSLHVVHLAHSGAEPWRIVGHVDDEVRDCKKEATLQLVPGALVVTDLDSDKHDEVSFAWVKSCRKELGPDALVLVLMEDDAKYTMHGSTVLMAKRRDGTAQQLTESGPARPPIIDAALAKLKPFATFATSAWEAWKVQLYVRE